MTAIGISLAVHAVLIGAWQLARPVKLGDDIEPHRVQFLRLLPVPAPEREASVPPSPRRAAAHEAPAHPAASPQAAVPVQSLPETIALPAPDGIDSMQRGIQPKVTSCPQHEEPARAQKWE